MTDRNVDKYKKLPFKIRDSKLSSQNHSVQKIGQKITLGNKKFPAIFKIPDTPKLKKIIPAKHKNVNSLLDLDETLLKNVDLKAITEKPGWLQKRSTITKDKCQYAQPSTSSYQVKSSNHDNSYKIDDYSLNRLFNDTNISSFSQAVSSTKLINETLNTSKRRRSPEINKKPPIKKIILDMTISDESLENTEAANKINYQNNNVQKVTKLQSYNKERNENLQTNTNNKDLIVDITIMSSSNELTPSPNNEPSEEILQHNTYNVDISQMLSSTLIEKIIQEADNLTNPSKENQNLIINDDDENDEEKDDENEQNLNINNTEMNALFDLHDFMNGGDINDVDDDAVNIDQIQSSQRFLSDIKKSKAQPKKNDNSTICLNETQTIITNIVNGSEYVQRQREMHDLLIENQEDDESLIESDLSKIYKSTQYRKEIESVFNQLEHSIQHTNTDKNIERSYSQECKDALAELNDINWDQNMFFNSPLLPPTPAPPPPPAQQKSSSSSSVNQKTSSEIIRQKLNEQTNEKITPTKMKPVSSSFFCNMGPFYGLPITVKSLISEYKGIDDLYEWQKECLTLPAIEKRNNLIYALPTSGGKTLVAEILLLREMICRQKNVIFVLPYVSIVQEKVWSLSPFAVKLNFLIEEYAAGNGKCPPRKRRQKNSVYICTIEKSMSLFDSLIENNRANEVGLIVIDELHLLGDQGRGIILESLLSKAMFLKADIQIVGMSATIGNINQLAQFINADVYTREFRPVELREYIKCGADILEVNSKALALEDKFEFSRTVDFSYSPELLRIDPDHVAGLVMEVIPNNSCLIFCHSKKNCENVAMLLCQVFQDKYLEHRKLEKIQLMKSISRDTTSPLCAILRKTLPYGVAYHHSGLITDERRHIEDAFRNGILCCICCTSTLAAGVNLPASRVILRSPYIGRDILTLSKYKQMIGRAGRTGLCSNKTGGGESILICPPKDNIKVSNLLCSPMDEAISGMHINNCKGIKALLLSAILLQITVTRKDMQRLIEMTLMFVQSKRLNIKPNELIDNTIEYLIKKKAIQVKNIDCVGENNNVVVTKNTQDISVQILRTQDLNDDLMRMTSSSSAINKINKKIKQQIIVKSSTELEISKLGKSSVRASIDLERSNLLYHDLYDAQKNLVLNDYLHLLYIVTPYDIAELIKPDMGVYYALFVKLNPEQLHTAKILGINESCAITMITGKCFKPNMEKIVNRFFVALMLYDLWYLKPVHIVAEKFHVDRGIVQNLMNLAACNASNIYRFCEDLEEFWAFKELLAYFSKRLSHCCTAELMSLMTLPSVKLGRARQLYNGGYKNLQAIAKATSKELVDSIEHLSYRNAKQLIAASKLLLLEKVETLREEAQDVLDVLNFRK